MESQPLVMLSDVHKTFRLGDFEIPALVEIHLSVQAGSFLVIAGTSGSGKTTLLNLVGCLDLPNRGQVRIGDVDTSRMSDNELSELRAKDIGFVFQTFNLLPVLTALENVEYPLQILKVSPMKRQQLAKAALHKVGLEKFYHHRPAQLSGGQRQRVAIARALVKNPKLILADEPTANLDAKTAAEILDLMSDLNQQEGVTFIFSTHDPEIIKRAKQKILLVDGRMVS